MCLESLELLLAIKSGPLHIFRVEFIFSTLFTTFSFLFMYMFFPIHSALVFLASMCAGTGTSKEEAEN